MKEERLEVRRRHGPTRLERLKWHVGTIAATVAAILLGLQIAGLILAPSRHAKDAIADLKSATGRLSEDVGKRSFPLDARAKGVDEAIGQLVTTFKHEGSAAEVPPGLTYPPRYLATLKPGESNEIRLDAPIDLVATAEAGGVALKWSEPPANNVKIATFEIFRKEGGDEPATIGTVDGATHAFRDASAKPGHTYEYTVGAVTADPDIANTPRGRSAQSAPASVKAVADFKIELVKSGEGAATFKVSKWVEGAWRDRTFEVREGGAIGGMDQALGVDFSTGRTLARLTVETSEAPVTREELVFDPAGRVVLDGGTPKRVTVSSVEVRRRTLASITGGALPDELVELADPVPAP
jgi:hypothetical protein